MIEFSAAWCLSIVGQAVEATIGVPLFIRHLSSFENGIHGDEKELSKANLHASNGIFVNFGRENVFFKQLEMLWIMKHSLSGKLT